MPSGVYDRSASRTLKAGRYAANTKIDARRTRVEIEELLRSRGADGMRIGWMGGVAQVDFSVGKRLMRVRLKMPTEMSVARAEKEEKRLWRALLFILRAKFEAVASGITTIEEEFIGATVVPSGQTVSEWLAPQIAEAYKKGAMPKLLLSAASSTG